jgi:hypothetical protein
VARAKKTDRAEARRRARAVAATNEPAAGEASATASSAPAKSTGSGAASESAPAARPSVLGAFREATRPIDLRGDIRRIPWLVTRTPAVVVPSLLVIGAAIWYASSGGPSSGLQSFAFQLLVYPPPQIGALFLAGILTDRMSYMAGGIVGLVCGVVFALYLAFVPIPASVLQGTQLPAYMLYGLILSPLSGLAIGGFAGFYRRFLRRANPNAGKRPPAKSKGSSKAPVRR